MADSHFSKHCCCAAVKSQSMSCFEIKVLRIERDELDIDIAHFFPEPFREGACLAQPGYQAAGWLSFPKQDISLPG